MCALRLPPISQVVIEKNAARRASDDEGTDCSRFKVDARFVRRYLQRARQVEGGGTEVHHALLWTPCYAAGTVTFRDGRSARWEVSQLRVGWLVIDGQDGRTLYCPRCKERPFAW